MLEPTLVQHATYNSFSCRFGTVFLAFGREPGGTIISKVQNNLAKHIYQIRSKYLFGYDGARIQVLRKLQTPSIRKPRQGLTINLLVTVDLKYIVENRRGNFY